MYMKQNRKRTLLTTWLCLLMAVSLQAQISLKGTVADAETGEPLIGATVRVIDTSLATITDIDGHFSIANVPAEAQLFEVGYVGMVTQTLLVPLIHHQLYLQRTAQQSAALAHLR